jgi:hypothetical protein
LAGEFPELDAGADDGSEDFFKVFAAWPKPLSEENGREVPRAGSNEQKAAR